MTDASNTPHEAGRGPTPEEEAAAERADAKPEDVREAYQESTERGANQEGEGRIP
jgi:hypothetical protein